MEKYAMYGAGEYGQAAYHILSNRGRYVSCWIDRDSNKWGTNFMGRPIISLKEWKEKNDGSKIILTVSVKHQKEIEELLCSQGIFDYEIFDRSQLYQRQRLMSYAHPNDLEDIMLYPMLADVASELFWIDVGCNDPCMSSVTKLYYDMGAHGINIDPVVEYIDIAKRERPRDINLCLGIGERPGKTDIFLNAAHSTMHKNIAKQGGSWGKREVEVKTLAQICCEHVPANQDVHLLKIDVEGFEEQVIRGMDWQICLPWVLCIESTIPDTDIPSYDTWEHMVLEAGYKLAFVYGVNRYYVSDKHQDLINKFLPLTEILQKYYVFHADVKHM